MEQLPKIVRQRLQATASAGVHPDPDLLTAFVEKSLKERESAQVLQHLAQCADCRNVVSLAMPEIVVPSTRSVRSRWLTWPVLRWGALAACGLVVSAAVTLRYGRQQTAEPVVAEKAPTSVPSSTGTLESRRSDQPPQKLAKKIPPPSPLPSRSDRAFDSVGMLAKGHDDTRSRAVAGAASAAGLENGRTGTRAGENSARETGSGQDAELADNRRLKTDGYKSRDSNKPSAALMGRLAASPPSTPSPSKSNAASAEEQTKERNESLDYAARASNQTVTVEAEAPLIETTQAAARRAKDESDKKAETMAVAGPTRSSDALSDIQRQAVGNKVASRWTLSAAGALQRSFDSGKSWQAVAVADNLTFRALAANDSDLWVGGAAGALYHSSDAGQHWTQVKPVAEGKLLTADIVGVEFTDYQNGKLTTSDRESWTTSDGGASWHRH
jgi:Photosynthesis system II assembly factor YCF48/Putative zinc-finger